MIISLTGFMGCGKSSVGRKLSELLCCRFMDLDKEIEEREGRSIADIFAKDGEGEFRRIEKDVLKDILDSHGRVPAILALGGGAVMTEGSEKMVHEGTMCIYLKASVDTLVEHLTGETSGRPLLNQETSLRKRILELMSLRAETYQRTAHITIETDGKSIDEIANEIIKLKHTIL
jgi:shikimate kinase